MFYGIDMQVIYLINCFIPKLLHVYHLDTVKNYLELCA